MQNGIIHNEDLRICSDKNRGMRKYMEDELSIVTESDQVPTTFLGVFDGHGGKEAAIYAREHLFQNIKIQPGFYDKDADKVKAAIRQGFLKTHSDMFNIIDTWPKRKDGNYSTSGTTATVVILRENKLFVAHVGDSAAVIAEKKNNQYVAEELTVDHKPESQIEKSRIEQLGGRVASSHGVPRVIWKRAVKQAPSSTPRYEYIPFLAVSRALGDLWSYDQNSKQFIVSPDPDIQYIDLVENRQKFVILASDGLWGVMNAKQAVDTVCKYELNQSSRRRNCSKHLVDDALSLWHKRCARADNITAIVVFLDDEFKTWTDDDDTESIASSEADTIIISNGEDDTPPMNTDSSDMIPLVRQITMPYNGSSSSESFSETTPSLTGAEKIFSTSHTSKRKIKNESDSVPPTKHKKSSRNSISPPLDASEDSHQCNVITVLSAESLYGLQLDENLDFVDDDESGDHTAVNSSKNMDDHLNYMPVPQVTK